MCVCRIVNYYAHSCEYPDNTINKLFVILAKYSIYTLLNKVKYTCLLGPGKNRVMRNFCNFATWVLRVHDWVSSIWCYGLHECQKNTHVFCSIYIHNCGHAIVHRVLCKFRLQSVLDICKLHWNCLILLCDNIFNWHLKSNSMFLFIHMANMLTWKEKRENIVVI